MSGFEELPPFEFNYVNDALLETLSHKDNKDCFLQWNVDTCMKAYMHRFVGHFESTSGSAGQDSIVDAEYIRLLKDFLKDVGVHNLLGFNGTPATPFKVNCKVLKTNAMSMNFFDRLSEYDIVSNGHIKGCFDETFHGITVQDKLREFLLNEDSENNSVYSADEQSELLFQIFKCLVIGGSMVQPDTTIDRYLEMTRGIYKDLLTVYKNPTNGQINVSGRIFMIESVEGVDVFSSSGNEQGDATNMMIVVIDPLKKHVITLKKDYVPFW